MSKTDFPNRKPVVNNAHDVGAVVVERRQVELPTYVWTTPASSADASEDYLDLFNATGSGRILRVVGVYLLGNIDVVTTDAIAIRVGSFRTSAVGTGGTAFSYQSATRDLAGGSVSPYDTSNAALPSEITGRHLPTGGATAAEWLGYRFTSPDETSPSMGYYTAFQNAMPGGEFCQLWTFREGEGLLLENATSEPPGAVAFQVVFTLEETKN